MSLYEIERNKKNQFTVPVNCCKFLVAVVVYSWKSIKFSFAISSQVFLIVSFVCNGGIVRSKLIFFFEDGSARNKKKQTNT